MVQDLKSGTPQHSFKTSTIRNPPIRRIVCKSLFDKIHAGKPLVLEHVVFPEREIRRKFHALLRATQHRLHVELIADDVFMEQIESEQRVSQVVQDTHEQHEIEPLAKLTNAIDGKIAKLNLRAIHL